VHETTDEHETERRSGTVNATSSRASAGSRNVAVVQVVPAKMADRGRENPGFCPQYAPTATQAPGDGHDTPDNHTRGAWAGGAIAVAFQPVAVNVSTNAAFSDCSAPTATHDVAERHETSDKEAERLWNPDGMGRRSALHLPPDRISASGCSLDAAPGRCPTATHAVAVGHESPCRSGAVSPVGPTPAGSGSALAAHVEPDRDSAKGFWRPPASKSLPTATQVEADGHDTAVNEAYDDDATSGSVPALQADPDRVSDRGPVPPPEVEYVPTATHVDPAVHDTAWGNAREPPGGADSGAAVHVPPASDCATPPCAPPDWSAPTATHEPVPVHDTEPWEP
jgi:hypothetical protein